MFYWRNHIRCLDSCASACASRSTRRVRKATSLLLVNPTLISSKCRNVGNTVCILYSRPWTSQGNLSGENIVRGNRPLQGQSIKTRAPVLHTDLWHAVFPCGLNTLIALGDYVVTESANCKACGKPAKQSCSHCNVHYCSKVHLCGFLLTPRTVK